MIEDKETKNFFEFLISNKANNKYTKDLKEYVIDAKHNTQWRVQYMTWERQQAYAFENGRIEGKDEKAREDAQNLLKEKISPEIIAKCTGLKLEEVLELEKEVLAG